MTGGSRGIGPAIAPRAAVAGCIVSRSMTAAIQGDIAGEADVRRIFDTVDGEFGPLTALVNDAGVLERQGRVDAMEAARLPRIGATAVRPAFIHAEMQAVASRAASIESRTSCQ